MADDLLRYEVWRSESGQSVTIASGPPERRLPDRRCAPEAATPTPWWRVTRATTAPQHRTITASAATRDVTVTVTVTCRPTRRRRHDLPGRRLPGLGSRRDAHDSGWTPRTGPFPCHSRKAMHLSTSSRAAAGTLSRRTLAAARSRTAPRPGLRHGRDAGRGRRPREVAGPGPVRMTCGSAGCSLVACAGRVATGDRPRELPPPDGLEVLELTVRVQPATPHPSPVCRPAPPLEPPYARHAEDRIGSPACGGQSPTSDGRAPRDNRQDLPPGGR